MPNRALRTAASGMYAQQVNIQVISNNLANINTTSFKKSKAEFEDLIYQEVAAHPVNSFLPGITENGNQNVQVGTGVKLSTTQKAFLQGDLQQTGNELDVAIHGEGFFQLRRQDGQFFYTRDGSFKVSSEGSLVTANGYVLEPGFTLDSGIASIKIAKDGVVSAISGTGTATEMGKIELAKFINAAGLKAVGDNMYTESPDSGVPILGNPAKEGFGDLSQGYLEASNVDIVEEMVAMISAQRAYEINSKTVKTVEDMMSMANNLKR